jgi:hypothetical protein
MYTALVPRKVFNMQKLVVAGMSFVLALVLFAGGAAFPFQKATSTARTDAATLDATTEILEKVSKLRGLEVKRPVKSGLKSKDEIEQSVIKDLDESTTPEEFAATQKTLARLGLVARDFRLREYVVKLLREQVAGFYEPKTQEFYLAAWVPISEQRTVMAHELMHALQDQHFNLRRFEDWPKGDSDAELAAHALIEGEATIMMYQYALDREGVQLDVTKLGSLTERMLAETSPDDATRYPMLAGAPAVLREGLQFPYIYGAGFVQEVLKSGSWSAVDKSYSRLPSSTEQIMHPERFITRDNPVKVDIADLARSLGPGWKRVDADVSGEFGYQIALREFIGKAAVKAAAGWGGDRYLLYENSMTGATMMAQFTVWDTAIDAAEFFAAYSERTEKRYKVKPEAAKQKRVYITSEGLVSIELRGDDVVIIEGAQNDEELSSLSRQVWQSKKSRR